MTRATFCAPEETMKFIRRMQMSGISKDKISFRQLNLWLKLYFAFIKRYIPFLPFQDIIGIVVEDVDQEVWDKYCSDWSNLQGKCEE